jgi:hypothetical protein
MSVPDGADKERPGLLELTPQLGISELMPAEVDAGWCERSGGPEA